ncbi:MAG: DUF6325 family protein [Actinomycetota bacterium]|nr:DUF6325 family protein [Actinomycetota bacterium]
MALGPIEVLEVAFPGSRFNGRIVPELERLVNAGIITVVDGILVQRNTDESISLVEFEEVDPNDDAARLASVMQQLDQLISDEDVDALASGLAPGDSAAILVFEHTWAKGFRDAIADAGGVLAASFRVPGLVVDELLDELRAPTPV